MNTQRKSDFYLIHLIIEIAKRHFEGHKALDAFIIELLEFIK